MRRVFRHAVVHDRFPIALLSAVIALTSVVDWWFGLESWWCVPILVEAGWTGLLGGDFSWINLKFVSTTVTCAFFHGDVSHLLGNMLFFWIFGSVVLEICGWRWMVAIFLFTAVGASLGQILVNRGGFIPMLGASGTVMGFEGAYLGLVMRKARPDPFVWPMARSIPAGHLALVGIFGVILDVMGILPQSPSSNVAYAAHIGGFLTGVAVSFSRRG